MDGSRDPFYEQFYARIPGPVASTFTDEQLDAIRRAYGVRRNGSHSVELRKSVPFLWTRLYVVLLVGRERRERDRLVREGSRLGFFGELGITLLVWALFILPWVAVLYAVKTAFGLDLSVGGALQGFWSDVRGRVASLFS
jgi:hypothetical protein